MSRAGWPGTVSDEAVAAAAEADNTVHRWPLTPRITRRLRAKGAPDRRAGFEAEREALGVTVTETPGGHLLMSARPPSPPRTEGPPTGAWVLWIHGGGFCWGTARDGTGLRLAAGVGVPVLSVEYPLAPEARFPAAIDVCLEAYLAGVRERGPRVLLGGVSAGANLALGVLQRLRSGAGPAPVGLVALTPFGDLAGEGDSYRVNEGRDAYVRWRGQQQKFARAYAGPASLADPLVSPVHADWSGEPLPPAFFSSGTRDLFLSDAARIVAAYRAAGGTADLDLAEGMWHSYFSDPGLPESLAFRERLLRWCGARLG